MTLCFTIKKKCQTDCAILQNWRAAVTLLCSVTPNLPGLINSINPKIPVGGAVRVFDFAWIFGVSNLPSFN